MSPVPEPRTGRAPDLRLPVCAAAAWCGALAGGAWLGVAAAIALLTAVLVIAGLVVRDPGELRRGIAATAVVGVGFAVVAAVGAQADRGSVTARAAEQGRPVVLEGTVQDDPRLARTAFSRTTVVQVAVDSVRGRGDTAGVPARPSGEVVVRGLRGERITLLASSWPDAAVLGARVRLRASPLPASAEDDEGGGSAGGGSGGAWRVRGEVEVLERPDIWWRGAAAVRASLRQVVAARPDDQKALVPSLVVGDDALVSEDLAEAFRTTGLTHLLAVSGTNLTLMMGVVLGVGVRCGVRGRWRLWLAGACVVGFVLVARGEPSVVRAATMGSVALFALERNGTDRGLRCLAVTVLVVLGVQPSMATSVGLALSVLATAGILLLAPLWSAALEGWLPRWAALGLAVPAAAQLACTPVVAALQGEVSLVAVLANIAAAPAVAPATVLGLLGALVGLVLPQVGAWVALPAAWSVGWIAAVARWCADLPLPAVGWGTDLWALVVLVLLCAVAVPFTSWLFARRGPTLAVLVVVLGVVLRGLPEPGWPPPDWVVVACDVGQGDALAVRVAPRAAVVVDAGPEPRPVRRCLDRLGVEEVPLLVLTHFHADHVDGLPGVLAGRRVGRVEVSPFGEPRESVATVTRTLATEGLEMTVAAPGEVSRVGDATIERVWPPAGGTPGAGEGDGANDASVVLLVEVAGVSLLLTGDVEPTAQRYLARVMQGRTVDVLKVPHHGSRHQDDDFLESLQPRVALVSAGRDNSYGHPSPELLAAFESRAVTVARTDTEGDLAVLLREGELAWARRGVR